MHVPKRWSTIVVAIRVHNRTQRVDACVRVRVRVRVRARVHTDTRARARTYTHTHKHLSHPFFSLALP